MTKPGFKKPQPVASITEEPEEPQFDRRIVMNSVRTSISQSLAGAAHIYSQLTELLKAEGSVPDEAIDYLREAVHAFAEFHDYIGAALGELAPSHHDKELWEE